MCLIWCDQIKLLKLNQVCFTKKQLFSSKKHFIRSLKKVFSLLNNTAILQDDFALNISYRW